LILFIEASAIHHSIQSPLTCKSEFLSESSIHVVEWPKFDPKLRPSLTSKTAITFLYNTKLT